MKKLFMILPLALILCFMVGCQDKAAMAELEEFKAQAAVEEQNMELTKQMFEAWGKGDTEAFKGFLAPDYVYYYPSGNPKSMSMEEVTGLAKAFWQGFPDMSFSMEDIFSAGDKVIFRFTQKGTQTGDFMGIPATGKSFVASGYLISRFVDGKVTEQWEEFDMMGMMTQLGMELKPKEEK